MQSRDPVISEEFTGDTPLDRAHTHTHTIFFSALSPRRDLDFQRWRSVLGSHHSTTELFHEKRLCRSSIAPRNVLCWLSLVITRGDHIQCFHCERRNYLIDHVLKIREFWSSRRIFSIFSSFFFFFFYSTVEYLCGKKSL